METLDKGAVEAVAKLALQTGSQLVSVFTPQGVPGLPPQIPVLVHPETGKVTGLFDQLAPWRTVPPRKSGTARVLTLESFIELVKYHADAFSALFAITDWQKPSLTAVIDYHGGQSDEPDNGKHRIHYDFPLSVEWQAWMAINGKPMQQVAFAEFIEDHIADLAAPDRLEEQDLAERFSTKVAFPNDIVSLSRGLQVNAEVRIKQATRLQSGEGQISYEEVHSDGKGQPLIVPGIFILNIAPFFMGATVRVPVRLRYRKVDTGLMWSLHLYRPDEVITERVRDDLVQARNDTGLPAYEGAPEMSAA